MQTLDPYVVSPKEMQELISLHSFLDSSGLDESLIELLRLHVSLLNGCTQGVRRHCGRLTKLGETTARVVAVPAWRSTSLFTEKERAALEWCEAVARISGSHIPEDIRVATRRWFTDVEIVNLTVIAAATTAWNRVEMSFPRAHSEI